MKRILVWDLPTRVFHWLLAAGVLTAFALATLVQEKSLVFGLHMLIGLALVPLLLFRLWWGFAGTRHARFRAFLYSPWEVLGYLKGLKTRDPKRHVGHNPAASYAIFGMFILLPATLATGLITAGGSELVEDLHSALAYGVLALVGAHLVGILVHALMHKENLVPGMITGKKDAPDTEGIPSSRPGSALVLFVVFGAWCALLANGYDQGARQLQVPFIGKTLHLQKIEGHGGETGSEEDD